MKQAYQLDEAKLNEFKQLRKSRQQLFEKIQLLQKIRDMKVKEVNHDDGSQSVSSKVQSVYESDEIFRKQEQILQSIYRQYQITELKLNKIITEQKLFQLHQQERKCLKKSDGKLFSLSTRIKIAQLDLNQINQMLKFYESGKVKNQIFAQLASEKCNSNILEENQNTKKRDNLKTEDLIQSSKIKELCIEINALFCRKCSQLILECDSYEQAHKKLKQAHFVVLKIIKTSNFQELSSILSQIMRLLRINLEKELQTNKINLVQYLHSVMQTFQNNSKEWQSNFTILDTLECMVKQPQIITKDEKTLTIKCALLGIKKIKEVIDKRGGLNNVSCVIVFCYDTFFIEEDLKFSGVNLFIISKNWKIIGNRIIDLKGADGQPYTEPALGDLGYDSNGNGIDGMDGLPGRPGHPGGSFYGKICSKAGIFGQGKLTIDARGGDGGQGQDGGAGGQGEDGEDATETQQVQKRNQKFLAVRTQYDWKKKNASQRTMQVIKTVGTFNSQMLETYRAVGKEGKQGGNGGRGGAGGLPGHSGEVKLEGFQTQIYEGKGKYGNEGNPGQRGKGGKNGCKYEGIYINESLFAGMRNIGKKINEEQVFELEALQAAEQVNIVKEKLAKQSVTTAAAQQAALKAISHLNQLKSKKGTKIKFIQAAKQALCEANERFQIESKYQNNLKKELEQHQFKYKVSALQWLKYSTKKYLQSKGIYDKVMQDMKKKETASEQSSQASQNIDEQFEKKIAEEFEKQESSPVAQEVAKRAAQLATQQVVLQGAKLAAFQAAKLAAQQATKIAGIEATKLATQKAATEATEAAKLASKLPAKKVSEQVSKQAALKAAKLFAQKLSEQMIRQAAIQAARLTAQQVAEQAIIQTANLVSQEAATNVAIQAAKLAAQQAAQQASLSTVLGGFMTFGISTIIQTGLSIVSAYASSGWKTYPRFVDCGEGKYGNAIWDSFNVQGQETPLSPLNIGDSMLQQLAQEFQKNRFKQRL